MTHEGEQDLGATRSRQRAEEWFLVLESQGFSPMLHRRDGHFVVSLPPGTPGDLARAVACLESYEHENPRDRVLPEPEPLPPPSPAASQTGILLGVAMGLFYLHTGPPGNANPWFEHGAAVAERIADGQYWRTLTALTLHASAEHAAGNAILGALLFTSVCAAFGPGLGATAILLAGALGNAINASAHATFHSSVGASTAVFAALGLLCGPAISHRHRRGFRGRHRVVPIAAGLGVLAMLGVGGGLTDIWAHLFGLVAGALLGIPLAFAVPRPPAPALQAFCASLALALLFGSWRLALLS